MSCTVYLSLEGYWSSSPGQRSWAAHVLCVEDARSTPHLSWWLEVIQIYLTSPPTPPSLFPVSFPPFILPSSLLPFLSFLSLLSVCQNFHMLISSIDQFMLNIHPQLLTQILLFWSEEEMEICLNRQRVEHLILKKKKKKKHQYICNSPKSVNNFM